MTDETRAALIELADLFEKHRVVFEVDTDCTLSRCRIIVDMITEVEVSDDRVNDYLYGLDVMNHQLPAYIDADAIRKLTTP